MEPMTPHQIIEGTANTLDQYGWTKGAFGSTAYGFCLLGAFWHTNRNPTLTIRTTQEADALGAISEAIRRRTTREEIDLCGEYIETVTPALYNDHIAETVEDIKLILKEATTLLDGETNDPS